MNPPSSRFSRTSHLFPRLALVLLLLYGHPTVGLADGMLHLRNSQIEVKSVLNLFAVSGLTTRARGCVWSGPGDRYQGWFELRLNDLDFDIPWAKSIMQSAGQFDTERYPVATLWLRDIEPRPGRSVYPGRLRMHGHEHPVAIDATITGRGEGLEVTGVLAIRQSGFGIQPYRLGIFEVADTVQIQFRAGFAPDEARCAGIRPAPLWSLAEDRDDRALVRSERRGD